MTVYVCRVHHRLVNFKGTGCDECARDRRRASDARRRPDETDHQFDPTRKDNTR